MQRFSKKQGNTSWQGVSGWYNRVTNEGRGHYYHEHVVVPGAIKLLELTEGSKILDLGCGNGVLAKNLQNSVSYLGVDISEKLVNFAKTGDKNTLHKYTVGDVSRPLTIPVDFTHSVIILALQNIANPAGVIANASRHMPVGGKLLIVLNHPMFRIPRQSSWGTDTVRKIQFRRIDKYLSPMTIPIRMNPSDRHSLETLSYHMPLSAYSKMLKNSGFVIDVIEEWSSDKESEVGRNAKMENRARSEFPLFMALLATKR